MGKYLIAPIILLLLLAGVAVASPAAFGLGGSGEGTPAPLSPAPTTIATAAPTPAPGALPPGATGRLTILSEGDFVTLELPGGAEVAREPSRNLSAQTSPDGRWTALATCDSTCTLTVTGPDGAHTLDYPGGAYDAHWSPDSARLAYIVTVMEGDTIVRQELTLLDPARPDAPSVLLATDGYAAMPYVWEDASHIVLGRGVAIERLGLDGGSAAIATAESPVGYFYPSPDGRTVAFTQNGADGWRLFALDLSSGALTDYGNMGSDPAGTRPPEFSPEQKSSMYVAWARDGRRIGFGGGSEAPYFMTIVDLDTGDVARTLFDEGYPGEIVWSPNDTRVAVSTYDMDRTRHEVYIVDPATGASRHVSSGCVIVWSPDGRYLAQHIDHTPGVGIVDVETGEYGMISHVFGETPLWWE